MERLHALLSTRTIYLAVLAVIPLVVVAGAFFWRLDAPGVAMAGNPTPTPTAFELSVDCNATTTGVQAACQLLPGPANVDVLVVLRNRSGVTKKIGAFNFDVVGDAQSVFTPLAANDDTPLDSNPNFNQGALTGNWACSPPPPAPDVDASSAATKSRLSCFFGTDGGGTTISANQSITLGRVHYAAVDGSGTFSLDFVAVGDELGAPLMSCGLGAIAPFGNCFSASVQVGGPDSDGDGVIDAFDNCVSVINAGQENADANFIEQSPPYAFDDLTRANSDGLGDACDADADNDGLPNATELAGAPCGSASLATNPLALDSDGDRATDGAECVLGTDPASAASKPTAPSVALDPDRDGLTSTLEATIGSDPNSLDTDGDGMQDGWEYRGHGTSPTMVDTDGDGFKDGCEVASLNNDTVVTAGDQALLAAELIRIPPPAKLAHFDMNKDGAINPGDQAIQAGRVIPGRC